jgi:hypothetical protein
MTVAEVFAAVVAALEVAFGGSRFKVWPTPPDATALPAVWPQFDSSNTAAGRNAGGTVSLLLVAALAPQTAAAENAAMADAHDRFDTIGTDMEIPGRFANLGPITIGGVDHTALLYTLTVARGLPC